MSIRPDWEFQRDLGVVLQYWRLKRGLTLEQLAQRSGVSASSLRRLERGTQGPRTSTTLALARALNCPVGELLQLPVPRAGRKAPPQSAPRSSRAPLDATARCAEEHGPDAP